MRISIVFTFCLRQRHPVTSFGSVRRNGGVAQWIAEKYLARAREIINVTSLSNARKQHNDAVGGLKLQAQLTRLLEGSSESNKNPACGRVSVLNKFLLSGRRRDGESLVRGVARRLYQEHSPCRRWW